MALNPWVAKSKPAAQAIQPMRLLGRCDAIRTPTVEKAMAIESKNQSPATGLSLGGSEEMGVKSMDAVAAGRLGAIERPVGGLHQRGRVRAIGREA